MDDAAEDRAVGTDPREATLGRGDFGNRTDQSVFSSTSPVHDETQEVDANTEIKEEAAADGDARKSVVLTQKEKLKPIDNFNIRAMKGSKKEWQVGLLHKKHRRLGFSEKENTILELSRLGFPKESIQAAVLGAKARSLEEAMNYIAKAEDEKWPHKFLSSREVQRQFSENQYCANCQSNKEQVIRMERGNKIMPIKGHTVTYTKNGVSMKNRQYYRGVSAKERSKGMFLSIVEGRSVSESSQSDKEDCFYCGDPLEEHDPDYNIELVSPDFEHCRPNPKPIKLKEDKRGEERSGKPECAICFDSELVDAVQVALPCGHFLCSLCLRKYIHLVIAKQRSSTIKCPVDECGQEISDKVVRVAAPSKTYWKRFVARRNEIANLKAHRLVYCPWCSNEAILDAPSQGRKTLFCDECDLEICVECHRVAHNLDTCAENLSKKYSRVVRGWKWQTCPSCKEEVKFASLCRHMTCGKCCVSFCVYCRKSQCANFQCNPLLNETALRFKGKKAICWVILLCLLLVLTSPLLALFLVPYIVGANLCDYFNDVMSSVKNLRESMYLSTISNITMNTQVTSMKMNNTDNHILIYSAKGARRSICTYLKIGLGAILAIVLSPLSMVAIIIISICGAIYYIIN